MTCMNPHRSYDNWKSTAITTTLVYCKPICSQLHCAFFSSPAFLLQYQKTPRGPPASSRTCRMEGGKERGGEGKDRANGLKQVQSTRTLDCCSHQTQDLPHLASPAAALLTSRQHWLNPSLLQTQSIPAPLFSTSLARLHT